MQSKPSHHVSHPSHKNQKWNAHKGGTASKGFDTDELFSDDEPIQRSSGAKYASPEYERELKSQLREFRPKRNWTKMIGIGILVVLVLIAAVFMYKKIPEFYGEKRLFSIEDICGPVPGGFIHSYDGDVTCMIRCKEQCNARDDIFLKYKFVDGGVSRCHECNCTCRKN